MLFKLRLLHRSVYQYLITLFYHEFHIPLCYICCLDSSIYSSWKRVRCWNSDFPIYTFLYFLCTFHTRFTSENTILHSSAGDNCVISAFPIICLKSYSQTFRSSFVFNRFFFLLHHFLEFNPGLLSNDLFLVYLSEIHPYLSSFSVFRLIRAISQFNDWILFVSADVWSSLTARIVCWV